MKNLHVSSLCLMAIFFLATTSLHSEDADKKRVKLSPLATERIRTCMGVDSKLNILEVLPEYRIFFLEKQKESVFVVDYEFIDSGVSIPVKLYFSKEGNFLRAESVSKTNDRKNTDEIEALWKRSHITITGIPDKVKIDLLSIWKIISDQYRMEQASEFNISLVQYYHEITMDVPKPALVLNAWGLENPMHISHPLPDSIKNKVCVIYDEKGNEIIRHNQL